MKTIQSHQSARHIFQNLSGLSTEQRELFERLLMQQGEDIAQLPIPPRDSSDIVPLSYPQERVWTVSQLTPDSAVDNVPVGFRILGPLDLQILEQSIQALIQRNEILRTHCVIQDRQIVQNVQVAFEPWLKVIHLDHLAEAERLDSAVAQATEIAKIPFDLTQDLLLRAAIFCLGEADFVLLLVAHQFVTDGLSFRFLLQELASLYNSMVRGDLAPLPQLAVQYADFSIWQRQWFTDAIFASFLTHWTEKLYGAPSQLRLPISHRHQFSTQKGATEYFKFSVEQSEQFKALCREQGVTVFMACVALFQTVLQRCTQQNDISVGTLISNRNRRETEQLVGNFSNNLLLRTRFTDELTFRNLLEQVKDTTLEAYNSQDLPFQYLFDRAKNIPKFQTLILLRNSTIAQSFDLFGLKIQELTIDLELTRMELNLDITDDGKTPIFGKLEYKTDLFDALTIQQIIQNLTALLDCVLLNPNQKLIEITLPAEIRPVQRDDNAADSVSLGQDLQDDQGASLSETQQAMADIWAEVLGLQSIGLHDNFFEMGGHSLLAVKLFAEIDRRLGKKLPLSILFQSPTVKQLDSAIYQNEGQFSWSPLVTIQVGDAKKIPLFCLHGGGFNVLIYRDLALKLDPDQPVYGLQARGLDGTQPLYQRFESIAADYLREIQTIQPEGPYMMAGLSNGGNLAYEMAQQLHLQGQKTILLAMFDTYGPNSVQLLPPMPRASSAFRYLVKYIFPRTLAKVWQFKPKYLLDRRKRALAEKQKSLHSPQKLTAKRKKTQKESFFAEVQLQKESPMFSDPGHFKIPNPFEQLLNQFSRYVLQHSPWAFFTPSNQLQDMDNTISETLKNLEAHYSKITKTYNPNPYPGKIVLFKAQEFPPGMLLESSLGWAALARDGVEVHTIPGHHTSIVETQELAEKLQNCIIKVQSGQEK
jgi:thioesterase domain-containing protein/acyl carrier protein